MIHGTLKFIFLVMAQIGLSRGLLQFLKHNITLINFTFIKALQTLQLAIEGCVIR